MAWKDASKERPPLHQQVLVELKEGVGTVCDVATYVGKVPIEGGGVQDRWILADVRLDTRQIRRWASIYPEPPRDSSMQTEREAVLAWLRREAREWKHELESPYHATALQLAAIAIERGDHLKEPTS